MVTRSHIEINDEIVTVGSLGEHVDEGFSIADKPSRLISYKNKIQFAVTYELSQTRIAYMRIVYSILDFFSDIGGLYGALQPIFLGIVMVVQFQGAYSYVMSDMFDTFSASNDRTIHR